MKLSVENERFCSIGARSQAFCGRGQEGKVGVVKIFRALRAQLLFLALTLRNVCIRHCVGTTEKKLRLELKYKNAVTVTGCMVHLSNIYIYGTVTGGEGGRGPTRTFSQIYYYNNVIQFANSLYYKSMQLQYYN